MPFAKIKVCGCFRMGLESRSIRPVAPEAVKGDQGISDIVGLYHAAENSRLPHRHSAE
jgi:hypothetical protein